jgi:DNA-binding NarL/FixJ family response regulator
VARPTPSTLRTTVADTNRNCTVVVCDDQKAFRDIVSLMLSVEPGLEVIGEAGNGEEAVRVVSELRPDIVLLDIAMPLLDGFEALPLILESAPQTQVVMLTGFTSTGMRERALSSGATTYIEKGTDVGALVAHIKGLCVAAAPRS